MVASPSPWNYRNHVQFHLTGDGRPGYVKAHDPEVFAATECHLPEGVLNAIWPQLEFEPGTSVERVSLRAGKDYDSMLILESSSPEAPEMEIEACISVAHVFEESTVIVAGNDHVIISVSGRDFRASATSFFQVNTTVAEKMVHHLITHLPITESTTVLDIYCGAGLFSAFFAPKCERVIGIESSPSACEDFVFNLDEFDNVELYEGLAEDVILHLNAKPNVVLVDPPRAGLERRVVDGILQLKPQVIAYVSCDPSTLARDAARLINGGYHLKDVTPFDLFPQTFHIESISLFER
jgi:23S rRNA (uracil1939-C5)-methyltransferase